MEQRFIPDRILDYCDGNSSQIGPIPEAILATSPIVPRGHMMVGRHVARLLQAVTLLKAPRLVLEIGTFHGFSAAAIADTLPQGAELFCCEREPSTALLARHNLKPYISTGKITLFETDGVAYLNSTERRFDMIFIDADKHSFCNHIDLLHRHLAPSGILIIDNAFAGLAVLESAPRRDWELITKSFNTRLSIDPRFFVTQLPLRDGITLAIRRPTAS